MIFFLSCELCEKELDLVLANIYLLTFLKNNYLTDKFFIISAKKFCFVLKLIHKQTKTNYYYLVNIFYRKRIKKLGT